MIEVLASCVAWPGKSRRATRCLPIVVLAAACLSAQSIDQAQAKQASGDWAAAAAIWRALAQATPADFRLWTSLGIALAHQERFAEAIAAYQKAQSIAPRDPQTNFNLGLAYFKTSRLQDAIGPLETAASVMPNQSQVMLLLGMCLYGSGHYVQAADALEKSRTLGQTENAEFKQVLAQCYLRTRQYDKAKRELTALLQVDPNSASTHMFLGEAEDASGHSDQAKEEFRAAIAANPKAPDLHFGLGYLYWKDRQLQEAETQFHEELRLDPAHTSALSYLGDVQLKRGEAQAAEANLRRALASGKGDWLTHLDLGIIASGKKRWPEAKTQLEKAAAMAPKRAEPHYRLAQVYKATGENQRAAMELRKVSTMHQQQEEDLVQKISGPKSR